MDTMKRPEHKFSAQFQNQRKKSKICEMQKKYSMNETQRQLALITKAQNR